MIPGTDAFRDFNSQERDLLELGQVTGKQYHSTWYHPNGPKDDKKGNKNPAFRLIKKPQNQVLLHIIYM
jgi:hypothetical protein